MSPKIVDKASRKQELALVALDVFADKGFAATSIADIAKAAGLGKGTLYEYFSSKDEIISSALVAWLEQVEQEASGLATGIADPAERLATLVRAATGTMISDERTAKLAIALFQEIFSQGQTGPHFQLLIDVLMQWKELIAGVIRGGVDQGTFRPELADQADGVAMNLMAYLDGISLYHHATQSPSSSP